MPRITFPGRGDFAQPLTTAARPHFWGIYCGVTGRLLWKLERWRLAVVLEALRAAHPEWRKNS